MSLSSLDLGSEAHLYGEELGTINIPDRDSVGGGVRPLNAVAMNNWLARVASPFRRSLAVRLLVSFVVGSYLYCLIGFVLLSPEPLRNTVLTIFAAPIVCCYAVYLFVLLAFSLDMAGIVDSLRQSWPLLATYTIAYLGCWWFGVRYGHAKQGEAPKSPTAGP